MLSLYLFLETMLNTFGVVRIELELEIEGLSLTYGPNTKENHSGPSKLGSFAWICIPSLSDFSHLQPPKEKTS